MYVLDEPSIGLHQRDNDRLLETLKNLRDMGNTWQTEPPYPNWKDYAKSLSEYAAERIETVKKEKGENFVFKKWFAENETSMRENSTIREKNNIVAMELLPIFEQNSAGWESVTFYNLGNLFFGIRYLYAEFFETRIS